MTFESLGALAAHLVTRQARLAVGLHEGLRVVAGVTDGRRVHAEVQSNFGIKE